MATARSNGISLVASLDIKQREDFLQYAKSCAERNWPFLGSFRTLLAYRDIAYQRQLNTTKEHIDAVRANMNGQARKIQDMTVPIVMPQVESATAYQVGVFLTDYPIFGVVSLKDNIDQAMKFETALADQAIRYGWSHALTRAIRRGFKYNFGPVAVQWKKQLMKKVVTNVSTGVAAGQGQMEDYSYGGNCIIDIDPYNCFMDSTVEPSRIHEEGEYFGWNKMMSRVELMKLLRSLDSTKTTQAKEAYESSTPANTHDLQQVCGYFEPQINQYLSLGLRHGAFGNGQVDWLHWMGLRNTKKGNINYKGQYVVTHFYCRARPSDFGRQGNQLVVFHGIIVNWSVVVFVEEVSVGHDYLPVFIATPYDDGLGYQTQSMVDNALPYQDMSSALWNISLEAKRRLVFDRLVYNPKMIDKKDIDVTSSVARIPLRNAAMVKDDNSLGRAIYQIPFRDVDGSPLQMSDMIANMADQATGQNKVDRGQFQKGNKTAAEFQTVMGNSNSRQQLVALSLEQQFMTPIKESIKTNTLMYQTAASLVNKGSREVVDIDPVELRKAMLEFKMTDGMLPAEKMLNPELLQVFMQTAQAIPGAANEYDIMGMFVYWAKLQGAMWLDDFKRDPQQQQQFLQNVQAQTAAETPPADPMAAQPAV